MTHRQSELRSLVAYELGARGEVYNPTVIFDTVRQLYSYYSSKQLTEMILGEGDNVSMSEAIQCILSETYSEAAMTNH